ncbi:MAG: tRNA uridine-5-carboxymethylaminomethyl(34) synthesis GTPase MnmE [Candidatus Cyclobacteriaceae bacterium M2_1C_046]
MINNDTIVAPATPSGVGALSVIRMSGPESISITNRIFKGADLTKANSHTLHFGTIRKDGRVVDEVLVSVFKAPHSFTKEDATEISCHGSPFIVEQIIKVFIDAGARPARAGEFTQRAFLNGRFDLAQAEAVADLINADSEASHKAAIQQMRGGFSLRIAELREKLVHFASMIELELDFSEEDVEFADRQQLVNLVSELMNVINQLLESFDFGNVIKKGVATVIAGKPNAGKSTLLNALLNEEKAIVSDIPGTTRDFIEDEVKIGGISFRFVDTAGLREATDTIEKIGVQRTKEQLKKAAMVIHLIDLSTATLEEIETERKLLREEPVPVVTVANKTDKAQKEILDELKKDESILFISAAQKENLEQLRERLLNAVKTGELKPGEDTIVTNIRHYDNLMKTRNALQDVLNGIDNDVTGDFLAMDIRQALHFLGEITGQITTDDLLENIFSKFCIGK